MLKPRRDSAVSPIIGVILLLGIAFALLAVLQVVGIPAWNFDTEFDHRQDVQEDMQRFGSGVSEVGATGSPRSVVVSLGTRYPNRVILLNPSPPSGSLRTDEGFVNVSNAEAVEDDVRDYWNGTRRSFSTGTVAYEPDYNYYDDAPSTVYENGLLYDIQDQEPVFLDDSAVVDGSTINLVSLSGSVSASQVGATTVSLVPVSTARRTVTVSNSTDDGVSLSLDSRLSADDWRGVLDGEPHVEAVSETDDGVEIELEAGVTYEMRLAEVGLGRTRSVEPAYIVGVSPQVVTAPAGGPVTLVAEVRDELNNPVSGAEVEANVTSGAGFLDEDEKRTGSEGRVEFEYEGTGTVEMSIGETKPYQNITFEAVSETVSDPDAEDPVIESATLERRDDDFGQAFGGFLAPDDEPTEVSQYVLEYEAASDKEADINLEKVYISLLDSGGDTISSTSHSFDARQTHSDTWTSPWLRDDDIQADSVRITVIDEAGNSNVSEIEVGGEVEPIELNFNSLSAEADVQEQQDRIRGATFSYGLDETETVTFSIVGFGAETETGLGGTVKVSPPSPPGQEDLPVTLRGEIDGGECLEIQVPEDAEDGDDFDLVDDGTEC